MQWVGRDIQADSEKKIVDVGIKEESMTHILDMTLEIHKKNQVNRRELRSYTGKANHVSTLIWCPKPFLDTLWAACESKGRTNAAYGNIWPKQLKSSLSWLLSFLRRAQGQVRRQWTLEAH